MSADVPKREKRSTLASTVVVTFEVADTSLNDTPTVDPINIYLRAFPTSTETAPD